MSDSFQVVSINRVEEFLVRLIQNRPGWASFNSSTGRLTGTPKNSHVGTYSNILVIVSDGSLSDSVGPFSITVNNTNNAPSISGSPATSATAGGLYSFQSSASDPDGDALTFSIAKQPSWASFNTGSGRLSGTPANGDADTYDGIVISVSDGSVSRSLPAFSITVSANLPSNRAPVIGGTPSSSVAEDSAYVFQPTVSDADGDKLMFSISNSPSWASFNSTGLLSGTPMNDDVGVTNNVLITVSDGVTSASIGPFSIKVNNANDTPVISGVPATSVAEGSAYNFQPTASDPDSDKLTFSISNKPAWASFNSAGLLSGMPKNDNVGSSGIVISVTDGIEMVSLPAFSVSRTAPVSRADGEPLSLADIGGYQLYFGDTSGTYTDFAEVTNGAATSVTVSDVPVGTSYVVMTTFDVDGRESEYSQEIAKNIP